MVMESKDNKETISVIKRCTNACTFDKLDVDKLYV